MASYKVSLEGDLLTIGFADPASNDVIVKDAKAALSSVSFPGGPLLKVTGPASLPVAFVIAHHVMHIYGAIGIYDPKLGKYVIAVSHGSDYKLGDLV